jgi:hypothetical protein
MIRAPWLVKAGGLSLLVVMAGTGCGSKNVAKELPAASLQLKNIGFAYGQATENQGPPTSKNDLIPYLKVPKDPDDPEKAKGPADPFRSANDGEEFVILWGVDVRNLNVGGNPDRLPVIAYEKYGKDGKRYILQVRQVRHLTDEEFRALPFPPGVRPP